MVLAQVVLRNTAVIVTEVTEADILQAAVVAQDVHTVAQHLRIKVGLIPHVAVMFARTLPQCIWSTAAKDATKGFPAIYRGVRMQQTTAAMAIGVVL